jgi:hypothetical protein
VLVGQHIAVRRYDHSRAGTASRASRLTSAADIDADHRRADMLDRAYYCLRVGIQRVIF